MHKSMTKLRFVSRMGKRVGFIATSCALMIVWTAITINLSVAAYGIYFGASWGVLNLLLTLAVAVGMYGVTEKWMRENRQKYYLTIEGDTLSLSSFDSVEMRMSNQKICLSDVTEAEYYKPRETSSLLLSGPSKLLDIPLWSFCLDDELAIVGYIRRQGVPLTGLPYSGMPF